MLRHRPNLFKQIGHKTVFDFWRPTLNVISIRQVLKKRNAPLPCQCDPDTINTKWSILEQSKRNSTPFTNLLKWWFYHQKIVHQNLSQLSYSYKTCVFLSGAYPFTAYLRNITCIKQCLSTSQTSSSIQQLPTNTTRQFLTSLFLSIIHTSCTTYIKLNLNANGTVCEPYTYIMCTITILHTASARVSVLCIWHNVKFCRRNRQFRSISVLRA